MKIGLIDVDSHARRKKWGATIYPNLALCKIAAYHKAQGDEVEWYEPLFGGEYDKVYVSKIFNFSPDYSMPINAREIEKGGTGYDMTKKLPQEIDDMQPDYSIYPTVPEDTSYGFLTRGCPNKCAWCVVPRKEGAVQPYWDVERVANGRNKIVLMDNNILAAGEYAHKQLRKIAERGYRIDFNQALDARLVTEQFAIELAACRWIDRIRFGCDTPGQIRECERAMDMITGAGYHGEYFLYTMIGGKRRPDETEEAWNTRLFTENYNRINHWYEAIRNFVTRGGGYNAYPYAQPYRDPDVRNEPPQWQKDMAQYCNKRMIFFTSSFADFSPRKGFKCREWIDRYYETS